MRWFDAARTRLRLVFARRATESRIDEEIEFHVEMETERLIRDERIAPDEARRRALVAFGGTTQHRETLRRGRGLAWLDGLSLDFKLAARMLAKYPGLTVVAVIGIAIGVMIGASAFSAIDAVSNARLPISEGNRVIAIRSRDDHDFDNGLRSGLQDLAVWREGLTTLDEIAAYRTVDRNLIVNGSSDAVRIAEMTASGFRITRTPPMLGRYFNDDDERAGATPVVVIGSDLWRDRFGSRPTIIGESVQLGDVRFVIVGVMPQGFAFPVNNRVWTPFRLKPSDFERGRSPRIEAFARLASGASIADVNRQLETIGQRLAASYPETHANIRTRASAYGDMFADGGAEAAWGLFLVQALIALLLVVIGTNVAILVYARTASRIGEITIRTALGASRGRVVAQFFAEALALAGIAAAAGLVASHYVMAQIESVIVRMGGEQMPYWLHFRVTPSVAMYAALLAIFTAVIVGVFPALKATHAAVRSRLQQLGAGGSGIQLGRTWTLLIVGQVAVSVAVLPVAVAAISAWRKIDSAGTALATKQILTATLDLDRGDDQQPSASRYITLRSDLIERLKAEPLVTDVALSSSAPGSERSARVETKAQNDSALGNQVVGVTDIDAHFIDVFDIPVLSGRAFVPSDFSASTTAVIINRSLARRLFDNMNPLGRRLRETPLNRPKPGFVPEPWKEVVGVIADFPVDSMVAPKVYRPLDATSGDAVTVTVRTRGRSSASFGPRLQQLTIATNPMLRLASLKPLEQSLFESSAGTRLSIFVLEAITMSTVLLSAAGIYALMAFTVARRRREIGIRSALGAGARRLLVSVFARAMVQVGAGIAIGISVAAVFDHLLQGGYTGRNAVPVLLTVALLMTTIGIGAALRPAMEALRIHPTDALRSE